MARKQQTSIVVPSIRRQMQSRARSPQLTHSRSGSGAWFGNADNGIQDLFAKNLHAEKCLCGSRRFQFPLIRQAHQFKAMLSASAAGAPRSGSEAPASQPASPQADASTTSTTIKSEADPITSDASST